MYLIVMSVIFNKCVVYVAFATCYEDVSFLFCPTAIKDGFPQNY